MGVDISSARLITKSELEKLGCSSYDSCSGAPSWVYSTSYWSGTADGSAVWYVRAFYGYFDSFDYDYDIGYGVRPVIEISESEF